MSNNITIVAGPCQHESFQQSLEIASYCANVCKKYNIDYYFKTSYDKANRTHISAKRGIGLIPTMHDFIKLKKQTNIKIVTDVHDVKQVELVDYFNCVDVIQIPAFLCRQTDLIRAAVKTKKIVNIKKGQFLAPWDVKGILSKTEGAAEIWITERGTSFGYNTLVVDFTGIQYMLDNYSVPIIFDVTHSVQKPGSNGNSTGGNRNYISGLARAAAALGVSSFFFEVHPDPDSAPSDGSNMLGLDDFEKIIKDIYAYSYTNTC
jgi:2-dehydro-3-deoxyphosphooctonate aldolase (KDO 8-P synthase)